MSLDNKKNKRDSAWKILLPFGAVVNDRGEATSHGALVQKLKKSAHKKKR